VIRELTVDKALPAGAAVRRALESRFGSRGGVARIYRLLAEEGVRLTPPPESGSVEALQHELKAMRGRAERAEEREKAHQTRWAEEIDQLRLRVARLEPIAQQASASQESNEFLRRQLQAAERRAALLEQQLYRLTQCEGQGAGVTSEPDQSSVSGNSTSSCSSDLSRAGASVVAAS